MPITLRPWQESDLDNLIQYANNDKIARNMTDQFPSPFTEETGKGFIAKATADDPNHILAIDLDGQAIGAIGIHPQGDVYAKNAELGYWLAEPFWGKGYMTQAIQQMVVYGFEHWDIQRIYARPYGPNIGSQKALEKAGFQQEARLEKTIFKRGAYLDELIYAIRRSSSTT